MLVDPSLVGNLPIGRWWAGDMTLWLGSLDELDEHIKGPRAVKILVS